MKNKFKKTVLPILAFALCMFSFSSCETTDSFTCPYLISNPHIELGKVEEKYNFAGLHFGLFNDSSKTVERFTVSFMLYDADGNNPFVGSNCIVSKCNWKVQPGACTDFVLGLDQYISCVPDEPYIIDYMYLREITYTDGSTWKDPYGMYCVREAYE